MAYLNACYVERKEFPTVSDSLSYSYDIHYFAFIRHEHARLEQVLYRMQLRTHNLKHSSATRMNPPRNSSEA